MSRAERVLMAARMILSCLPEGPPGLAWARKRPGPVERCDAMRAGWLSTQPTSPVKGSAACARQGPHYHLSEQRLKSAPDAHSDQIQNLFLLHRNILTGDLVPEVGCPAATAAA